MSSYESDRKFLAAIRTANYDKLLALLRQHMKGPPWRVAAINRRMTIWGRANGWWK